MKQALIAVLCGIDAWLIIMVVHSVIFSERVVFKKRLREIQNIGSANLELINERKGKKQQKTKNKKIFNTSEKIKNDLKSAGVDITPEEYLMVWVLMGILPALFIFLIQRSLLVCIMFLVIGICIPPFAVSFLRKKRLDKFSVQLGDALMTVGNCLRSGFSFQQAIERISIDMPDPIRAEFKIALSEMDFGVDIQKVLGDMAIRMENKDLELINSALAVQQKVGGNLAEIIDNVSETIKDRIQIRQTLRTLTSQGRMSGLILGLLPVIMLVAVSMLNPDYMEVLFHTAFGKVLLLIAAVLEGLGFLCIKKIIDIKI